MIIQSPFATEDGRTQASPRDRPPPGAMSPGRMTSRRTSRRPGSRKPACHQKGTNDVSGTIMKARRYSSGCGIWTDPNLRPCRLKPTRPPRQSRMSRSSGRDAFRASVRRPACRSSRFSVRNRSAGLRSHATSTAALRYGSRVLPPTARVVTGSEISITSIPARESCTIVHDNVCSGDPTAPEMFAPKASTCVHARGRAVVTVCSLLP